LPVAAWQLPANPTLSQLCRAWILATPAGQSALEKRIKAEGARSPLRTLKQTAWDEPQTGSGLLAAPVGQRFSILWKNGLFREAWNELALRGVPGRTDHPARRHYWFARFAEKAGLSRQAIFHLRRCLQTSGFGIEAAVLEKLMPGTILRDLYPRPFRALTENPGSRTPVPPLLIEALMRQESAFDANAVSWAGAVGLMQLMPGTAREIAERLNIKVNLFDPADNVRLGTSYLAWVLSLYDEPAPGLAAYNAGPGRITRWRRQLIADHGSYRTDLFTELLPLAESRGYIKIVLSNLMVYTLLYQ
jgi:hypothetical protein